MSHTHSASTKSIWTAEIPSFVSDNLFVSDTCTILYSTLVKLLWCPQASTCIRRVHRTALACMQILLCPMYIHQLVLVTHHKLT